MLTRLYSSPRKNREDGFTLIELLIVVIIIGILAAIALPIFLNQQKAAADARVQSDVRNTVDSVQTFLVKNSGTAYASTSAYTTAGGAATITTGDTVGVNIGADGSYQVCGYVTSGAGNQFKSASAAFTYTTSGTAAGTFATGTCVSGSDTGGAAGGSQAQAPTGTVIFTSTFETGDPTLSIWNQGNLTAAQAHAGTRSISEPYTSSGATTIQGNTQLINGKTYVLSGYARSSSTSPVDQVGLQVNNSDHGNGATQLTQTLTPGGWTSFSFTFTVKDANPSYMSFYGIMNQNSGGTLYLDDVTLTQTN